MKEIKGQEEIFFARVKEPSEIKRSLLESLKDIVENLHRFEKFKSIRQEKVRSIDKLRADIKELIKLNSSLKVAFPETKLRVAIEEKKVEEKKERPKHHVHHKKAKKKFLKKKAEREIGERMERSRPATELEKLESELNAIESRLSSLK